MSKSPSLRRIQADIRELALDPSDQYHAAPLEDDMFEWHFTIRGASGTEFEGGVYHGRILLPPEYPFKPPHILFLTPSGRFETHTKICLSFTAFHEELWQPAWGIRLILEALISFLPTPADGAIGALDWSKEERKRLAIQSMDYSCPRCGKCVHLLPERSSGEDQQNKVSSHFSKEIAQLQQLQQQEHRKLEEEEEDITSKERGNKGGADEEDAKPAAVEHTTEEPALVTEISDNTVTEPTAVVSDPLVMIDRETAGSEPKNARKDAPSSDVSEHDAMEEPLLPPPVEAQAEEHPPSAIDSILDRLFPDTALRAELVFFAVVCYLFLRKIKAMQNDLWELKHLHT